MMASMAKPSPTAADMPRRDGFGRDGLDLSMTMCQTSGKMRIQALHRLLTRIPTGPGATTSIISAPRLGAGTTSKSASNARREQVFIRNLFWSSWNQDFKSACFAQSQAKGTIFITSHRLW